MFYWYNQEVKWKKMKKIAIAFGIIACLAVLSLLLTSASAADWMHCPGGWGDLGPPYTRPDPVRVDYMRDIEGVGKEDIATTIATHEGFMGINAELSARGTGFTRKDRQEIVIDSAPSSPTLGITSYIDKGYTPVSFSGTDFDIRLRGEIRTNNYKAGAMVSERYLDTEEIDGWYKHTGTNKTSKTSLLDRAILGTTRFAVTVKDPVNYQHTIMRSREEHTGYYNISREVDVTVYP